MAHRFAIFSTGHAGSTWLAHLFPRLASVATFHEPLTNVLGSNVLQALASTRPSDANTDPRLHGYRQWLLCRQREFDVFGEIHTGEFDVWPTIERLVATRRALVTRNPVQVVHSQSLAAGTDGAARRSATRLRERIPSRLRGAPDGLETFAMSCVQWAQQLELIGALPGVDVVQLETLTSDADALQRLVTRLTDHTPALGACADAGREVLNRKVEGDRSPGNLYWNVWSDARREVFELLCEPAMASLGYSLPERAQGETTRAAALPPAAVADARTTVESVSPRGPAASGSDAGAGRHDADRDAPQPSLANVWVFRSNPRPGVVLVVGHGRRALCAVAHLDDQRSVLVRTPTAPWRPGPACRLVAFDVTGSLVVRGIYVVDDDPATSTLRAQHPHAEWVAAFADEGDGCAAVPARGSGATVEFVGRFGPLASGQVLDGGWAVGSLAVEPAACVFELARDGETVRCTIDAAYNEPHRPPARCAAGAITYVDASVPYDAFGHALRAVARAVDAAAVDRTVPEREQFERLAREATRASWESGPATG